MKKKTVVIAMVLSLLVCSVESEAASGWKIAIGCSLMGIGASVGLADENMWSAAAYPIALGFGWFIWGLVDNPKDQKTAALEIMPIPEPERSPLSYTNALGKAPVKPDISFSIGF